MKERIISAVIALLIAVPLLLLGEGYFKILVVVIGILGLKELMDLKKKIPNRIKYVAYILFVVFLLCGYDYLNNVVLLNGSLLAISFIILLTAMLLYDNKEYKIDDVFFLMGSVILLSFAFYLFIIIRDTSLNLMIYLLLITIMTDTFAYIIGSKFGKNKLMPKVSPNKSIEGFLGGLVFGTLISSLFYINFINNSCVLFIVCMSMVLSIIGQFGDLVFSSIKRTYKIKDFSNLMPGHGGILDRLDSIIFVLFTYIIFSAIL